MKMSFWRKFWLCVLAVIVVLGLFNFQRISNFLFGNRDPNVRDTRTLMSTTPTGQERRTVFEIPKGYYNLAGLNKEGDTIDLTVEFPNKEFVPRERRVPSLNEVSIQITHTGFVSRERTSGDRFKTLIDTGALESEARLKLAAQEGDLLVLQRAGSLDLYIFYDALRGHWIESRQVQDGKHRIGEGMLKDQTAFVQYAYRTALEPNPIIMHQWVMAFVENLQTHNQVQRATKK